MFYFSTLPTRSNQRVMLTFQVAQAYNCSEDRIKMNFQNNKEYYLEGMHYFKVEGAALENLRVKNFSLPISPMTRTLYLWTQQGVMRHCKSINTPEAWAQFDKLEKFYFAHKTSLSNNRFSLKVRLHL
ncbi:MAG: ORF6N domain-containing protein [Selenomonadaceae bacterium]|nr:ORF6N domain-containing protein [Selenomonadaceae bacterium]